MKVTPGLLCLLPVFLMADAVAAKPLELKKAIRLAKKGQVRTDPTGACNFWINGKLGACEVMTQAACYKAGGLVNNPPTINVSVIWYIGQQCYGH